MTDNFSWQWIFLVNLVPGALAAAIVATMLRDPVGPQPVRIDWPGIAILALGLGTMQIVLDNGERLDWFNDGGIALAAVTSLACLLVFCRRQWTGAHPVVDLHVLRFRSVAVGCALALAFGALVFAPAIVTPLYSSAILNYTAWDSGLLLVVRASPVILLTPVFATLAQNGADVRYMLGGGFAITAISLVWMDAAMTSTAPFAALGWPLFLSGVGQSMLLVPLIIGVLTTTPAALNGKIAPLITLCVQLGGSMATAASVAFFDRRSSFHATILSGASTAAHLASLGLQPTHDALLRLAELVNQQATTMAFADTIFAVGILAADHGPVRLALSPLAEDGRMSESLAAAERFAAEVNRTGAAAPLCDRAVWAYLSALGAPTEAAWAGFYRCVYAAVRDATARGSASPGALAPLLALLDDDFGARPVRRARTGASFGRRRRREAQ